MIALLTGRLAAKTPTHVTLDVQGVGYEVFIPLATYYGLPDLNQTTTLAIHTHLRDDAIQLYGFLTQLEKDAYLLLTSVSGIGPKLGLSVLSTMSVHDVVSAIQNDDVEKLATVPGIGKKSAARLVLELKDKMIRLSTALPATTEVPPTPNQIEEDAVSALVNLGYRPAEVKEILKRVRRDGSAALSLKDTIRIALKELARG